MSQIDLTEPHLSYDERKEKAYQMIAGIEAASRSLGAAGYCRDLATKTKPGQAGQIF